MHKEKIKLTKIEKVMLTSALIMSALVAGFMMWAGWDHEYGYAWEGNHDSLMEIISAVIFLGLSWFMAMILPYITAILLPFIVLRIRNGHTDSLSVRTSRYVSWQILLFLSPLGLFGLLNNEAIFILGPLYGVGLVITSGLMAFFFAASCVHRRSGK